MKFEIYPEVKSGMLASASPAQWRWRLVASNGKIVSDSGEGYFNKSECQRGIDLVKGTSVATPVFDLTYGTGLLGLAANEIAVNGIKEPVRNFVCGAIY
jgi:uncharacterized protein YegP (UPF0339 family)